MGGDGSTAGAWARWLIQIGAAFVLITGAFWIFKPGPNFAQIVFRWGVMILGLVLLTAGVAIRYAYTPRG